MLWMTASEVIREARQLSGLPIRTLGERAGTSHSTIAAYEAGRVDPGVATLERVLRGAGFEMEVHLERRIRTSGGVARGDELAEVLRLAEAFPRRNARTLRLPRFAPS